MASEDDDWLNRVRGGDFAAIPHELTWLQSARLAHLPNGYEISRALDLGDLAVWANARAEEAALTGTWTGNAVELWACLFFEHRRWRHFGEEPNGGERALLDRLTQKLRQLLCIADAQQRVIILRLLAANTAATER